MRLRKPHSEKRTQYKGAPRGVGFEPPERISMGSQMAPEGAALDGTCRAAFFQIQVSQDQQRTQGGS